MLIFGKSALIIHLNDLYVMDGIKRLILGNNPVKFVPANHNHDHLSCSSSKCSLVRILTCCFCCIQRHNTFSFIVHSTVYYLPFMVLPLSWVWPAWRLKINYSLANFARCIYIYSFFHYSFIYFHVYGTPQSKVYLFFNFP